MEKINNFFNNLIKGSDGDIFMDIAVIISVIILAIIVDLVAKRVILKFVKKVVEKSKNKWDDIFYEKKSFLILTHIFPAMIVYLSGYYFRSFFEIIEKSVLVYLLILLYIFLDSFLNSVDDIYNSFEFSKSKPIKSYIQLVKVILFLIIGLFVVATIIGKSPWKLLGGIGAMTAILMLVFKDLILGLVAGIQLSFNKMVKIGDWISMPSYGADGDVIEIGLTTLKVRNFDKTITTIPVYALVSNSFKNWDGMVSSGCRRIKRSINIDLTTIKFANSSLIEKLKNVNYLNDYILNKEKEIDEFNKNGNFDLNIGINGRRQTNIGLLRAYIKEYLDRNTNVDNNLSIIVRQLQPANNGLPLEIYCFLKETRWAYYEGIQSDIFDHILAIIPEFELEIFQEPTGNDFKSFK